MAKKAEVSPCFPWCPRRIEELEHPVLLLRLKRVVKTRRFVLFVVPCLNYHNLVILLPPSQIPHIKLQIPKHSTLEFFNLSSPNKKMADHLWSFSWVLTIQYFAHFFVIQLTVHWGMEAVSDAFLLMWKAGSQLTIQPPLIQ